MIKILKSINNPDLYAWIDTNKKKCRILRLSAEPFEKYYLKWFSLSGVDFSKDKEVADISELLQVCKKFKEIESYEQEGI